MIKLFLRIRCSCKDFSSKWLPIFLRRSGSFPIKGPKTDIYIFLLFRKWDVHREMKDFAVQASLLNLQRPGNVK